MTAERTAQTRDDRFYVTGGTLRPDAPSYVERQADRDLYEGLFRGEFCYLLTSRQVGKSSLMVHTAARLREAGVAVVMLDLTAIGQHLSVEQWYGSLLSRVGWQLDMDEELEQFWQENSQVGPLERWMRSLQQVVLRRDGVGCSVLGVGAGTDPVRTPNAEHPTPSRLVIFLDEIDAVRSLPFSTDEFFAAIRECYNRRSQDPALERLTFCLLGVATPSDLIRNSRMTPFNIGRRIELTDFTLLEAAPLEKGLACDERLARELLQRVLYWTGGHPYLTQRLCQAVALQASDEGKVTSDEEDRPTRHSSLVTRHSRLVDRHCASLFLSPVAREKDDNLLFVRDRLLRSDPGGLLADEGVAGLLDLYARLRSGRRVGLDDTNPLIDQLRLSGIVRTDASGADGKGRLVVRNRIYERVFDRTWVRQHMPGAELRRQRAAYRRGLLRATAAYGALLALIGALAFGAFQSAEQRQVALDQSRRLLYVAEMNLAQQAWEAGNVARARRLLESQRPRPGEEDLRGFEWRYLWRLCRGDARVTLRGDAQTVEGIALSRDGKTLATGGADHTIKLWDLPSGTNRTTLGGHKGWIVCLAFSPDQKTLASVDDQAVRLWDLARRREVATLGQRSSAVWSARFSPDGKMLAGGGRDGTVTLWDVASRRVIAGIKAHTGDIWCVRFSPDGKTLVTASTDTLVKLWDVATRKMIGILPGHTGPVIAGEFSPDGRRLATGGADNTIRLWDVEKKRQIAVLMGHGGCIRCLAFSPDGKLLASASNDMTLKLWNVARYPASASTQEIATFRGHQGSVTGVRFSPDARTLISASEDGTIKLWSIGAGAQAEALEGHTHDIWCLVFSPDGKHLASGSNDHTVRLWDLPGAPRTSPHPPSVGTRPAKRVEGGDVRLRAIFPARTVEADSVAFSPDSRTLALCATGDSVTLRDVATGRERATLRGHRDRVDAIAFSPDGRLLASQSADHTVKLWDLAVSHPAAPWRPRAVVTLSGYDNEAAVCAIAFSPDGKLLASGGVGNTVKLWDLAARRELPALTGHEAPVHAMAFSPDGRILATGGFDRTIRVWDTATWREIATLRGFKGKIRSVLFSPDGTSMVTTLADAPEPRAEVWDTSTWRRIATLLGHAGHIYDMEFSPDGKTLATGSADSTVKLWSHAMPQEAMTLKGHRGPVYAIAFSPDGTLLATGGADNTVRLWRSAQFHDTDRVAAADR
jgi:WD40 repeat protein